MPAFFKGNNVILHFPFKIFFRDLSGCLASIGEVKNNANSNTYE